MFGAVTSLIGSAQRTKQDVCVLCTVNIIPDKKVGESLVIQQGNPKSHEIINLYDCELPGRQNFRRLFISG